MDLQDTTSAGERKIRGLPAPKRKNGLSRATQSSPTVAFTFAGAGVAMLPFAAAGFGGGLTRQVAPTVTTGDDVDFGDFFKDPKSFEGRVLKSWVLFRYGCLLCSCQPSQTVSPFSYVFLL